MNLLELGVESAGDHHSPPFEAMHQIGPVEAVNLIPDRQDEIAAEMLDAIDGACIRRAAHRLRLEHFLMRPRERVHVQGALAVGNFSAKDARVLPMGGAGQRRIKTLVEDSERSKESARGDGDVRTGNVVDLGIVEVLVDGSAVRSAIGRTLKLALEFRSEEHTSELQSSQ